MECSEFVVTIRTLKSSDFLVISSTENNIPQIMGYTVLHTIWGSSKNSIKNYYPPPISIGPLWKSIVFKKICKIFTYIQAETWWTLNYELGSLFIEKNQNLHDIFHRFSRFSFNFHDYKNINNLNVKNIYPGMHHIHIYVFL